MTEVFSLIVNAEIPASCQLLVPANVKCHLMCIRNILRFYPVNFQRAPHSKQMP